MLTPFKKTGPVTPIESYQSRGKPRRVLSALTALGVFTTGCVMGDTATSVQSIESGKAARTDITSPDEDEYTDLLQLDAKVAEAKPPKATPDSAAKILDELHALTLDDDDGLAHVYTSGDAPLVDSYDKHGRKVKLPVYAAITLTDGGEVRLFDPSDNTTINGSNYEGGLSSTENTLPPIIDVFEPIIKELMASGKLRSIYFTEKKFTNEGSFFDSISRDAVIVSDDGLTEIAANSLLHELIHAGLVDMNIESGFNPQEVADISRVCSELESSALEDFLEEKQNLSKLVTNIFNDVGLPADAKSVQKAIEHVIDSPKSAPASRIATLEGVSTNELADYKCKSGVFSTSVLESILSVYSDLQGIDIDAGVLNKKVVEDDLVQLNKTYSEMIKKRSLYAILNQGNYLHKPEALDQNFEPEQIGHTQSDTPELPTGSISTLILYGEDLAEHVKKLDEKDQRLIIEVLRQSVDLVSARSPLLGRLAYISEEAFLAALNKT